MADLYYVPWYPQGNFTVELYYRHAPRTCHNIAELARSGYYNGTVFHRIIKVREERHASCLDYPPNYLLTLYSVVFSGFHDPRR